MTSKLFTTFSQDTSWIILKYC